MYKYVYEDKKDYVLFKQLLRSGTSIETNEEEQIGGQSEKDFYSKLKIAFNEAKETCF